MSALAGGSAAAQSFLARFEGLKSRLPGGLAAREAAAAAFAASGLPGRALEAWKYTSLQPLADAAFHEPFSLLAPCDELLALVPPPAAALDVPRLVFRDGRLRDDLSNAPDFFTSFADAPRLEADARPLVALNTMLAEDGAVLDLPAGTDGGTLLLIHLASDLHGQPTASHPRHIIRLGAGARLDLIEISVGRGCYLHNPVFRIELAANAALGHVRLQDESAAAFHLASIDVTAGTGALYDGFTFNAGGRLCRAETIATIAGQAARIHLDAAQLLRGNQHGDITTIIRHGEAHGSSRQSVRHVLDGHARGVFQGRIEVARGAQKTDGYQMNQALLLSADAEIDCKPELEIFADDVKCSHGATVGELDADQLFYLRARGVPADTARQMLIRAFLDDAIEALENPAVRAALAHVVDRSWAEAA